MVYFSLPISIETTTMEIPSRRMPEITHYSIVDEYCIQWATVSHIIFFLGDNNEFEFALQRFQTIFC